MYRFNFRFQDKENGRTGPVYVSISINELLSSIATSVVYGCIGTAKKEQDTARLNTLSNTLDLVGAIASETLNQNTFLKRPLF